MHTRSLIAVSALILAILALPVVPVSAAASCLGRPATHVMQPGDPTYNGTPGNDVVVGSSAGDAVNLNLGGVDLVCGNGGNDALTVFGPGSIADGGSGDDTVYAFAGATARGGSGNDFGAAFNPGSRAEGGSAGDTLQAFDGATADGGSGNDLLQAGTGAAALLGGAGSDTVTNMVANPNLTIDCGSAYDVATANGVTDIRRCEVVT